MTRRPPSTAQSRSSAASDVYKRQVPDQTAGLAAIGVTDFNAGVFAANPDEVARTNSVLRELA